MNSLQPGSFCMKTINYMLTMYFIFYIENVPNGIFYDGTYGCYRFEYVMKPNRGVLEYYSSFIISNYDSKNEQYYIKSGSFSIYN